jgi:hypothetical protein
MTHNSLISISRNDAILAIALASFAFSPESRLEAQEHNNITSARSIEPKQEAESRSITTRELGLNAELLETLLSFRISGDRFVGSRSVDLPDSFTTPARNLTLNNDWEVVVLNIKEVAERSQYAENFLKDTYQAGMSFLAVKADEKTNSNLLFVIEHDNNMFSAVLFVSPNTGVSFATRLVSPILSTLSDDMKSLFVENKPSLGNKPSVVEVVQSALTTTCVVLTLIGVGIVIGESGSRR